VRYYTTLRYYNDSYTSLPLVALVVYSQCDTETEFTEKGYGIFPNLLEWQTGGGPPQSDLNKME
jgi:hypothetical protein